MRACPPKWARSKYVYIRKDYTGTINASGSDHYVQDDEVNAKCWCCRTKATLIGTAVVTSDFLQEDQ